MSAREIIMDVVGDTTLGGDVLAALKANGYEIVKVAEPVIGQSIQKQINEGGGFWCSCSGCFEAVDGHSTEPTDIVFQCQLGVGCHECGGIGAVWDNTDYSRATP